jgi:hypothetical protein
MKQEEIKKLLEQVTADHAEAVKTEAEAIKKKLRLEGAAEALQLMIEPVIEEAPEPPAEPEVLPADE